MKTEEQDYKDIVDSYKLATKKELIDVIIELSTKLSERPDPTETLRQELIEFFDWHYSGGGELNSGLIDQYLSETAKTRNDTQPNRGVSTEDSEDEQTDIYNDKPYYVIEQSTEIGTMWLNVNTDEWVTDIHKATKYPARYAADLYVNKYKKGYVSEHMDISEPKQVKSKEEILKDNTKHTLNIVEDSPLHKAVMEAMEEYANQFKNSYESR